jgi:hypothetical protein
MAMKVHNNRELTEVWRLYRAAPQAMAQVDSVFHFNSHGLVCFYLIYLIN